MGELRPLPPFGHCLVGLVVHPTAVKGILARLRRLSDSAAVLPIGRPQGLLRWGVTPQTGQVPPNEEFGELRAFSNDLDMRQGNLLGPWRSKPGDGLMFVGDSRPQRIPQPSEASRKWSAFAAPLSLNATILEDRSPHVMQNFLGIRHQVLNIFIADPRQVMLDHSDDGMPDPVVGYPREPYPRSGRYVRGWG
ncbi:hypothetical protein ACIBEF_31805 [Micromonospora sp. NPDC050795]|uniref:hypothetical protein n=1 Tax=Micromonospora sp. NPDC050795 TaxID=3364282 RepID=UPI0037BD3684